MKEKILMSYYPKSEKGGAFVSIHNGGGENWVSLTIAPDVFIARLVAKNLVSLSVDFFKFYGDDGIALYVLPKEVIPYFGTRAPEQLERFVKEMWQAVTLQDVNDIDFFFFVANPQPTTSPA